MTKRERAIVNARIAGYHGDSASFTQLVIYARIARRLLDEGWMQGVSAKSRGMGCDCYQCKRASAHPGNTHTTLEGSAASPGKAGTEARQQPN